MKNNKRFYAISYYDGKTTTTGEPNEITGSLSIACDVYAFNSKYDRDSYVNEANSHKVIVSTAKEARNHCLGMRIKDYKEMLDMDFEERYCDLDGNYHFNN